MPSVLCARPVAALGFELLVLTIGCFFLSWGGIPFETTRGSCGWFEHAKQRATLHQNGSCTLVMPITFGNRCGSTVVPQCHTEGGSRPLFCCIGFAGAPLHRCFDLYHVSFQVGIGRNLALCDTTT